MTMRLNAMTPSAHPRFQGMSTGLASALEDYRRRTAPPTSPKAQAAIDALKVYLKDRKTAEDDRAYHTQRSGGDVLDSNSVGALLTAQRSEGRAERSHTLLLSKINGLTSSEAAELCEHLKTISFTPKAGSAIDKALKSRLNPLVGLDFSRLKRNG